jgi:hypothetical protein
MFPLPIPATGGFPMRALLPILLALSLSLFFLGCASQESPAPAPSPPPSQPNVTDLLNPPQEPNATPMPPPEQFCTITLPRDSLSLGDEIFVEFEIPASTQDSVSYSCGGSSFSGKGPTTQRILCKFTQEGAQELWAKVNGKICASKNVSVTRLSQPASEKSCSLEVTLRDPVSYLYEATATFSGYEQTDKLEWDCGGQKLDLQVGSSNPALRGKKVSGSASVFCDFISSPGVDTIPVTLSGDSCGTITIR